MGPASATADTILAARGWAADPVQVECPICLRHRKPWKLKYLYDVNVCPKCRNSLANRRQAAYLADWLIYAMLAAALDLGRRTFIAMTASGSTMSLPMNAGGLAFAVTVIGILKWPGLPFLFALKDAVFGRSPGKWLFGLRVVDVMSREPIGPWQSIKRNLILTIPTIGALAGVLTMMKGQRWGDGWAKTMVVVVKHAHRVPYAIGGRYCRQCGYDLTGNTSGRCPECGLDAPVQPAAPESPIEPAS